MVRHSRSRGDPRTMTVSALMSICSGAVIRYGRGATRQDVVDELRARSDDPDVLAEAASVLAIPHPAALAAARIGIEDQITLLMEAGADPAAFKRHSQERQEMWDAKPFDLGAFADLQNRWETR